MIELKSREIAAVKRQFKNSLPALKKIESIDKKIAELQEERDLQEALLNGGEAGIMAITGGYRSVDLIKCEYVPVCNEDGTPKIDEKGYQMRKQVLTFVDPTVTEEQSVDSNVIVEPGEMEDPLANINID